MYCSQCGAKAEGRFCSACGSPLAGGSAAVVVAQPLDWPAEIRYDVLMRVPEVRERISRQAGLAPKRFTGQDFLRLYDKIASPAVPMEKIAAVVQPLYAAMGIATGKCRTEAVAAPPGRVLVRALCSLARRGQVLRGVRQAEDGCLLEAALPSDFWSFEGDLLVTVRRQGAATAVEAATKIKGQLYDWGKSRRCLNQLFGDLEIDPP